MRIATAIEREPGKRLVANRWEIITLNTRKPHKKWLPNCKTSGLRKNVESIFLPWDSPEGQPSSWQIVHQHSKLRIANRPSKEES